MWITSIKQYKYVEWAMQDNINISLLPKSDQNIEKLIDLLKLRREPIKGRITGGEFDRWILRYIVWLARNIPDIGKTLLYIDAPLDFRILTANYMLL